MKKHQDKPASHKAPEHETEASATIAKSAKQLSLAIEDDEGRESALSQIVQAPSNVAYPQQTAGISRNLQADLGGEARNITAPSGGGDLNGSANIANLLGQAGTAGVQITVPRANIKASGGNYCGIV